MLRTYTAERALCEILFSSFGFLWVLVSSHNIPVGGLALSNCSYMWMSTWMCMVPYDELASRLRLAVFPPHTHHSQDCLLILPDHDQNIPVDEDGWKCVHWHTVTPVFYITWQQKREETTLRVSILWSGDIGAVLAQWSYTCNWKLVVWLPGPQPATEPLTLNCMLSLCPE